MRTEYQKAYHATHREEAAERKALERDRRERCRSYWYGKLVFKRELKALIHDVTPEMLEEERLRYLAILNEPCEVVHTPPGVRGDLDDLEGEEVL